MVLNVSNDNGKLTWKLEDSPFRTGNTIELKTVDFPRNRVSLPGTMVVCWVLLRFRFVNRKRHGVLAPWLFVGRWGAHAGSLCVSLGEPTQLVPSGKRPHECRARSQWLDGDKKGPLLQPFSCRFFWFCCWFCCLADFSHQDSRGCGEAWRRMLACWHG